MFFNLFGKNYLRRKLLSNVTEPIMKAYLSNSFPDKKKFIKDIPIVSLDIETTGLDIKKDNIVSIGLVQVDKLGINLGSSWHQIITTKKELNEESVVIHKITDDQSEKGVSIDKAIPILLEKLSGKVMLAHNAKVEQGFINKICQSLYGCDLVIPIIDTQYLAKRSLDRAGSAYKNNDLRLFNLRRSFNMPAYTAHNALMDAIATAELFLYMVDRVASNKKGKLKDYLS